MFLTFIQSFTFEILFLILLLLLLLQYTGLSTTTTWTVLKNNQAIITSIVLISFLVEIYFILLIFKTYWWLLIKVLITNNNIYLILNSLTNFLYLYKIVFYNLTILQIQTLYILFLGIYLDVVNLFLIIFNIGGSNLQIFMLNVYFSFYSLSSWFLDITLFTQLIYSGCYNFLNLILNSVYFIIQIPELSLNLAKNFFNSKILLFLLNFNYLPLFFNNNFNLQLITADFYQYNLFDLSYFTFYNKYIILFFLIIYYFIIFVYYKNSLNNQLNIKSKFNYLFSYEYPILLGFIYLGYILVISTNNLLLVYLGFEIQTFVILIISGQLRTIYTVAITSLKYFFFSFLSSLMFLLSLLYLYNFSYSLNYYEIYLYLLYNWEFNINNLFIYTGLVLLLLSFFFKLGVFPFYIWVLDIFEGFPRLVTLLLLTLNKFNLYIFLIKFLTIITTFNLTIFNWVLHILTTVSLMSLFVGSLLALTQTNIQRFFGATSITHMGLLLLLLKVSLLATENSSYYIIYSYFIIYMSLTFLFFFILLFWTSILNIFNSNVKLNSLIKKVNFNFNFIKDFSWLNLFSKKSLVLLTLILLNFSGFPPFSFFYIKFNLMWLLTAKQLYFDCLLILYFSTLITGSYFRLISIIYSENSNNSIKISYLYKYIFQLNNSFKNCNYLKLAIVKFETIIILITSFLLFYNYFFYLI